MIFVLIALNQVMPLKKALSLVILSIAGSKNPCTYLRYIKRSQSGMLKVTKNMGI